MPVARGKESWKFGVPRYRIATYRRYNAHFLFTTTLKSGVVQVWFWDLVYSSCASFFFLVHPLHMFVVFPAHVLPLLISLVNGFNKWIHPRASGNCLGCLSGPAF